MVFTIFIFMQNKGQIETQVELIIITYLNKIVVSHTSTMIMLYMNVLQFDVSSICCILVYWLPTYWEIYEIQYFRLIIGSEIQFGQLLFNCTSSSFSNVAAYATLQCRIHACCSGVLWLHLYHRALELWETTDTKMRIVERVLHLSDAVSSRLIATQRRCFIVARSWSFD